MSTDRKPQRPGREKTVYRHEVQVIWRSLLGGTLVMVPGVLGFLTDNMWLFPSLGPSVFLLVVTPHLKAARAYNTFVGHLIAIACGYLSALALGATGIPAELCSGHILVPQIIASGFAVAFMTLLQLSARAYHPPGASTALLITLGGFEVGLHDFLALVTGVTIVTVIGEAARRYLLWDEQEVAKP